MDTIISWFEGQTAVWAGDPANAQTADAIIASQPFQAAQAAIDGVNSAATTVSNVFTGTNWTAWGIGIGALVLLVLVILLLHELETL